ncbi:aldehyde dehydrogenase family protein [Mycoplasmopsis edwardii]|nr:aldehyde dehydrogenase family protein [Mycoplasmopsis edwardii]
MNNSKNLQVFKIQKNDYLKNGEISVSQRIEILLKLKKILIDNQNEIENALFIDLGKSKNQAFYSELALVFSSLKHTIKNISKWTKKSKVKTPWFLKPSKSYIKYEAHGVVGIYSPWNYPIMLTFDPLIAAIAAGNRVMLKVSEYSVNTSDLIMKLINSNFEESLIYCSNNNQLEFETFNNLKFDFIFFTGSTHVGKIIAKRASENLIPCVLELGGKSPTIVFDDANIKNAAKMIAFGKYVNSGQTCVTHDFILVHENVADDLQKELKKEFEVLHSTSSNSKIISQKHFERLLNILPTNLLDKLNYNKEKLEISPIVFETNLNEQIMKEEIFGSFLPVIKFKNSEELKTILQDYQNPLALYIFTKSKKNLEIQNSFKSGSVIINDTISFLSNYNLPFGGVRTSGLGRYHGFDGFKAFSNQKSYFKSPSFMKPNPLVYGKESKKSKKILEWIFK